jgi:HEAT repeat protein
MRIRRKAVAIIAVVILFGMGLLLLIRSRMAKPGEIRFDRGVLVVEGAQREDSFYLSPPGISLRDSQGHPVYAVRVRSRITSGVLGPRTSVVEQAAVSVGPLQWLRGDGEFSVSVPAGDAGYSLKVEGRREMPAVPCRVPLRNIVITAAVPASKFTGDSEPFDFKTLESDRLDIRDGRWIWKRLPPTVELLTAASQDKDFSVRRLAVAALGTLQSVDPRAVQPLLAAVKDEDPDTRETAERSVSGSNPASFELLVAAVEDKDPRVRRAATGALPHDPRSVDALLFALRDSEPSVRAAAANSLGRMAETMRLEDLTNPDPAVRAAAASRLDTIHGSQVGQSLIAVLEDLEVPQSRSMAAYALGELRDARAVDPLIRALKSEDASLRKSAAEALGRLNDPRSLEPLRALLKDKDEWVRKTASWAIYWTETSPKSRFK